MTTSVKLSVTARSALQAKYAAADLKRIDAALKAWTKAEKARGITTVHVALDSAADMKAHGLKALQVPLTSTAAKEAIDALAKKLVPDYIVIVGGDDVVPYFRLRNPAFEPGPEGDPDQIVFSDNPYATARPFNARSSKSYLVPDRVVGRLPDLPAGKGKGDPTTLLAALATATKWKPQPRSFFKDIYATSTATWKAAGVAMMKYLEFPEADLMVAPPTKDANPTARKRLARPVHMTKCHGDDPDSRFFGESLGHAFPPVLSSPTLATRVKPGALVAAVCCYGAGIFAPSNPLAKPRGSHALPMAAAYLHAGALAFMGSTKIAYVGDEAPLCADWIVASYLKKALNGASLGRAMLEAKQDFLADLKRQGATPDTADEKTMIEFVLLGDPAIHPVASTVPLPAQKGRMAAARRATLRAQRRAARVIVAAEVEQVVPTRTKAASASANQAKAIFKAGADLLARVDTRMFEPKRASVETVAAPAQHAAMARMAARRSPGVVRASRSAGATTASAKEYTWWGRIPGKPAPHAAVPRAEAATTPGAPVRLVVMKVQTDPRGNVIRSRILHGA